ncbi:MAG: 50S ribosomal protein L17 [Candidatus Omnitrophica bacterium]|nr:50S ribosomal protein L17 [Candidatus Omnitrophota bacterium]
MRHRKNNIRLGRKNTHRVATLRSLAIAVLTKESIRTTRTKAKEAKSFIDNLITMAKSNTPESKREVFALAREKGIINLLFNEVAPRFKTRNGGYTRVIPLSPRRGDGSPMAILELVEKKPVAPKKLKKKETAKKELKPGIKKEGKDKTKPEEEPKEIKEEPQRDQRIAPAPKADVKEEIAKEKAKKEEKKIKKGGFLKNIRRYFRGKTP